MTTPPFTITNEQINSLPLLLGIIEDMRIRTLIDTHVTPHGAWQGASVGPLINVWLSHMLIERDHRLSLVRNGVADRAQTINTLLSMRALKSRGSPYVSTAIAYAYVGIKT